MSGRPMSARAIATRCCMPPESWLGQAPAEACRPIRRSSASARPEAASTSLELRSRVCAASWRQNRMFSITVIQG